MPGDLGDVLREMKSISPGEVASPIQARGHQMIGVLLLSPALEQRLSQIAEARGTTIGEALKEAVRLLEEAQ